MIELVIAFFVLILVIAGMAVGVIMGRKPLKGSCGGVGAALGEVDYECDICGGDPNKCDEQQGTESVDLSYDATQVDTGNSK